MCIVVAFNNTVGSGGLYSKGVRVLRQYRLFKRDQEEDVGKAFSFLHFYIS